MGIGDLRTDKTWAESLVDLTAEFEKWGIADYVLPTYNAAKKLGKVVVRFAPNDSGQWNDMECSIGSSKWSAYSPEVSLRAIYLAIEAARKADQRGLGSLLARATAHLALPASSPYRVLGVPEGSDKDAVRKAYMGRVKALHPDVGGNRADFEAAVKAAKELGVA